MCKHQNCVILEEFEGYDMIVVRNGVPDLADREIGDPEPTGRFFVMCADCGLEKKYISNRPRWLDRYLDQSLNLLMLRDGIKLEKVYE